VSAFVSGAGRAAPNAFGQHRANGNGTVSQTFCQSGRDEAAWSDYMTRAARIAVAVALLLAGTSLATAKSRGAAGAHGKPFHPGINETTSRPTAADPYYRLADPYYGGYSDTSRPIGGQCLRAPSGLAAR
jgi:hypothetical protein